VQVCPTGIDIRNGLQYQCIGCAHCIDACAEVMDRMGYAKGLIRYTTLRSLDGGPVRILRGRSLGYALICGVLVAGLGVALFNRELLALDIVRPRDALYRELAGGIFANDYEIRLANKTQTPATYRLTLDGDAAMVLVAPPMLTVSPGNIEEVPVEIHGPRASGGAEVTLRACTLDLTQCAAETTTFIASATR
jgi:polyferredoxin